MLDIIRSGSGDLSSMIMGGQLFPSPFTKKFELVFGD